MSITELLLITLIWIILLVVALRQKLYIGVVILVLAYLIYISDGIIDAFNSPNEIQTVMPEMIRDIGETTVIPKQDSIIVENINIEVDSVTKKSNSKIVKSNLIVKKILICKEVNNDREPIEPGNEFLNDIKVLSCFTAIENPGYPTSVTHIWYYKDREMARIDLYVGTSAWWRLWSDKRILPNMIGNWSVSVVDSNGVELGSTDFQIIKPEIDVSL